MAYTYTPRHTTQTDMQPVRPEKRTKELNEKKRENINAPKCVSVCVRVEQSIEKTLALRGFIRCWKKATTANFNVLNVYTW